MRKTKSIVWLAAAALAAVLAIVAGCKHDDEDDWTPVMIRGTVLEKYAGQRTDVTIPDGVTGIGSRAFSGSDVTAVVIPSEVTSIAADAFDGSKVKSVSFVALQEEWNGRPEYGLQGDIKAAYFIIDKNGMLTGYEGDETEVVIPAGFVKGIADKDIGDGVFSGRDITVVTIPGSVRRVGTHAFAGCTALKDVRIEAGVADIGAFAFTGCTKLESATIPAGARRLGGGIFNGCTGLTGLSVHESVTEIASGALVGTERLEAITYTGRKAQWEKLVADKERDFVGKRVYCQDGDDWWYGPERDTGDDPAHTHDFKYDFLDKDSHKKGCKLCDYAETEAHVYDDDSDAGCNKCGYVRENSGDSECNHDLIVKHNAGGHYQKCTKCDYQSASVSHEWSGYTYDNGTHSRTCTTAGCGYSEPVDHKWSVTYTTDAGKHYKTCTIDGCTARSEEGAHVYDDDSDAVCNKCGYAREISGDSECDHDLIVAYNKSGHYQECTKCDYQSASVSHEWSKAYTNGGTSGHYQNCTVCGYQSDSVSHKYKYEKIDDGKHRVTCEVCDYSADRTHDGSEIYTSGGADGHYRTCASCGEKFGIAAHDFKYEFDKDNHQVGCKVCDYSKTEAHVYDNDSDTECNGCGYAREISGDSECKHNLIVEHNESGHYQKCTKCNRQVDFEEHNWSGYTYDNKAHSRTCTVKGCGYTEKKEHSLGECESDGEGGHKKTCTARCGYSEPVSHTWSTTYTTDANKHYKTCTISGCTAHNEEGAHDYNGAPYQDDGNGKHYQICKVCKHQSAPVDHNYANAPYTDDKNGGHYQTCTADGCNARTAPPTPHNFKYKKIDDDTHLVTCEQCDYFTNESHNITKHEPKDDNQHYEICEMCEASMLVVHEYEYTDIKDDSHTKTCKICNHLFVEEHHYDDDADTVCNGCGYKRPLPPGDLKIEGGTLTIGKNGEVTEYKTDSSQDTPVNVDIPDDVTGINDGVFSGIWNLGTVTVPGSVESIGASAFADSGIQNVTLNGVKDIGDNAFNGCYRLVDVTIANGTETIGKNAFEGCGNLETVTIPGSVTSIGDNAFDGCGLTSVTIADGVKNIGSGAFQSCGKLETVAIPGSVTAIGNGAFQNCGGLTEAVIENGVKEIAVDMFEGCHKLESVEIPQSVDAIGSGAFKNCSSLKEVNSLDGVKSIGDRAFQGCHGFKSITIPDSVTSIGDNAFDGCTGIIEMTISKNVTSIGMDALACGNLTTITYTGTLADWLTLFSSSGIKSGVTVNCSNGTIKTP